jgi:arginyl-tRNA synthetase
MNIFKLYKTVVLQAVRDVFPQVLDADRIAVGAPKDFARGDLTTNAALILARPLARNPQDIADQLAAVLRHNADFAQVDVVGGYINITLAAPVWQRFLTRLLADGPQQFGASAMGANEPFNVEFISANPTGPLHLGHARGAIFGDVLANLLRKAGYNVTKEYYINDHGVQVAKLAQTLYLRYEEQLTGTPADIPAGLYPGEYMIDIAQALVAHDGDKWLGRYDEDYFRTFAIDSIMTAIKSDIASLGITMDLYSSENALYTSGKIAEAIAFMQERHLAYRGVLTPPKSQKADEDWEPQEQLLFRATAFGDDVDRTLVKSNGDSTYFLSDIAYHLDKYRRGFTKQSDVWGADHAGYVRRLTAAVTAVTAGQADFAVSLMQIVRIMKGDQPFRMSKRAGTFIMLSDLLAEITADELRFYMLTRKGDAQMTFDLDQVKDHSKDNLVFYVQYAHARATSVLTKHAELTPRVNAALLTDPAEKAVLQQLSLWPSFVEEAAKAREPHRVTSYLKDLATSFHSLWTAGTRNPDLRFVIDSNPELTAARLALVHAVQTGLASALAVLGVTPKDTMELTTEV